LHYFSKQFVTLAKDRALAGAAYREALKMTDQDWPHGWEPVMARDADGRNAVPARVGLKRTAAGLAVAAECDGQTLIFPLPDAARFVAAFQVAIQKHTEITSGGIG
jgi:hypothetical protein